jgi:hypothetical protein
VALHASGSVRLEGRCQVQIGTWVHLQCCTLQDVVQMERALDPDSSPTLAKSINKVKRVLNLSTFDSPHSNVPNAGQVEVDDDT